jgi:hypothetical protein
MTTAPAADAKARRFLTQADAERAHEEWGANCGPGAVAAIMEMPLDVVRPFFAAAGFEGKRYTNPTMMNDVLRAIGRPWFKIGREWPRWGLVRVQWEGPWTQPGVPMAARYRHTHWIGSAAHERGERGIFDINCISNGTGWVSLSDWRSLLVPWLLEQTQPRANGKWHVTHAIEVKRAGAP